MLCPTIACGATRRKIEQLALAQVGSDEGPFQLVPGPVETGFRAVPDPGPSPSQSGAPHEDPPQGPHRPHQDPPRVRQHHARGRGRDPRERRARGPRAGQPDAHHRQRVHQRRRVGPAPRLHEVAGEARPLRRQPHRVPPPPHRRGQRRRPPAPPGHGARGGRRITRGSSTSGRGSRSSGSSTGCGTSGC